MLEERSLSQSELKLYSRSTNFDVLGLARFAFMHCIGSSLCFWMNIIIDETMDSLIEKLTKKDDYCHPEDYHTNYGLNYYNDPSMIQG